MIPFNTVLAVEKTAALVAQTGHDWLPTIGAIIISLITGAASYWKNRPKSKNDQFKMFMDESAEFRDEMRKERENLKDELDAAHSERVVLKAKILEYEKSMEDCNKAIKKHTNELEDAKTEIAKLISKITNLKEKLMIANGND